MSVIMTCLHEKVNGVVVNYNDMSQLIEECGQFRIVRFKKMGGGCWSFMSMMEDISIFI